jgi:O-antigen biosynthesis protein WbqP
MKRLLDIFVSLFAILLLIFPFIVISILIKFDSKGPILHFSRRVGLNNKRFKMPKFRTMYLSVPQIETNRLKNPSLYITKVGKFLRRFSIDELPQLFLVFFGTMTLVGPRPALFNQLNLIKKRTKLRLNKLKPGITGLAQIKGRDLITLKKKVLYDLEYLKKKNLYLDLRIIFITVFIVIKQRGIAH